MFFQSMIILSSLIFANFKEYDVMSNKLRVSSLSGPIEIKAKKSSKLTIIHRKLGWSKNCKLQISNNENEFLIIIRKSEASDICEMRFLITLPLMTKIEIMSGKGDISINKGQGDLDLKIGSGKLSLKNIKVNSTKIKLGRGAINFNGISKKTELDIGAGDASFYYKKIEESSKLKGNIGAGNFMISIPNGESIDYVHSIGVGKLVNEIAVLKKKNLDLNLNIGVGDITFSYNKK